MAPEAAAARSRIKLAFPLGNSVPAIEQGGGRREGRKLIRLLREAAWRLRQRAGEVRGTWRRKGVGGRREPGFGSAFLRSARVCGDSAHGGLQIAAFSASGDHVLKYAARRFSKSTIFAAP